LKYLLPILFFILLFIQNSILISQECADITYMQDGKKFESKSYDKKGNHLFTSTHTVKEVMSSDEGKEATIVLQVKDVKGKDDYSLEYTMRCDGENLHIEIISLMSREHLVIMDGKEIKMESQFLRLPRILKEEDQLSDGDLRVYVTLGKNNKTSYEVSVFEREVLEKETVTVNNEKYDCHKVTYVITTEEDYATVQAKVTEWWTKDLLMVKSERYDLRGKLTMLTELVTVD